MLEELRKGSTNILVKALLIIVVLSFVIWGVGDMFRGRVGNHVAEVGKEPVLVSEFEQALRQEIQRIQKMSGGSITTEQMMAMQVDRMVLERIINGKLIEQEAKALGIRIGKEVVEDQVVRDPAFRDADGKFDKNRFLSILSSNNLTEHKFVDLVKKGIATDFLVDGLTSTSLQPNAVARLLYTFRNEQRKVDLLTLTPENITAEAVPAPSDAALQGYYDKHKNKFAVPEYRAVSYVVLKSGDVAKNMPVDEAALKKIYEEQKSQFQAPERRNVDNMLFDSEEKAKAAWERLNKQEDFLALAKELTGAEKADVELGLVTKEGMLKEMGDTVFSLAKNAYSAPIKGPFGWSIFRVKDIKPASEQPFEEVREQIAAQMRSEQAGDALYNQVNAIEDAFASGSTLEEVAKTHNLKVRKVDVINNEGQDAGGTLVEGLPGGEVTVNLVFNTNQGEISPMTITPDNTEYVAVRVDAVTEPRVKALDEVKAIVQEAWAEEKQVEALKTLADKLTEKLKNGTSWQEATQDLKVRIETGKTVSRSVEADILIPPALQQDIFNTPSGNHTKAHLQGDNSYVVALVREVIPAKEDQVKLNTIKQELASGSVNDLMEQYNVYLRQRFPVTVNEQLLKRAEQ